MFPSPCGAVVSKEFMHGSMYHVLVQSFHPLAGQWFQKINLAEILISIYYVSIPLRGNGFKSQIVYFYITGGYYHVSIPLRGNVFKRLAAIMTIMSEFITRFHPLAGQCF